MRYTFAAILVMAGAVSAQVPPIEFKGVPLGATKDELLAKLPAFECYTASCSLYMDDAVRKTCTDILSPSYSDCRRKAVEGLWFGPTLPDRYRVELHNGTVGSVVISFPQSTYSQVIIALTEKYGTPSFDKVESVQNRVGATFENRVVRWERSDGEIRAEQRFASVDSSGVIMTTREAAAAKVKRFEDGAKAKAKSL